MHSQLNHDSNSGESPLAKLAVETGGTTVSVCQCGLSSVQYPPEQSWQKTPLSTCAASVHSLQSSGGLWEVAKRSSQSSRAEFKFSRALVSAGSPKLHARQVLCQHMH